ncbi:MAG: MoxR family ATPase [Calditrichaeota bacterium]|nr:MoxR family ATPase [Calditrichota bacterium]MCB0268895.1 MoxR family ATPase [Calditrichota bacterium]
MDEISKQPPRVDVGDLQEARNRIRAEIRKIIVGQENMVDLLIAALLADGHVLIEGVPGVAKTLAARLLARTLSVAFGRIQFTPDLMPSDILGTNVFNQSSAIFEFNHGPIFANIVLIDEINRAPAKTQAALFEVMEERQITMDGKLYPMDQPFMVVATQNPVEHEGTYRLPEAQLDRFLFKISVPYPNLDQEKHILREFHDRGNRNDLNSIQPVLNVAEILSLKAKVRAIHIEEKLLDYIATFADQTRNHPSLYLGASPRASLALLTAAKAMAALRNRDFVTPEDIQDVITPTLQHRLLLTPEKEMEGQTTEVVIRDILQRLEIPR